MGKHVIRNIDPEVTWSPDLPGNSQVPYVFIEISNWTPWKNCTPLRKMLEPLFTPAAFANYSFP